MNILIIGGYNDPSANYHYSDCKTLQLALGFYSLGHYVTMPEESDHHDNTLINRKPFYDIKPQDYHLIIFTRENYIKTLYDHHWIVKQFCNKLVAKRDGKYPIICARYGKHNWYSDLYQSVEELYHAFDYHFLQEFTMCKRFISDLGFPDHHNKIWFSNMAVPENIDFSEVPPFVHDKKILIYIGRLRQVPSRYDFISEFMNRLGSDYKLKIIPGSFNKDDDPGKYSPIDSKTWLVNKFSSSRNIEVLDPIPWGKHWDYLYYADYGIDITPSVFSRGFGGGNAKLVEYMRAGLPTITEPGVTNSQLISLCNGGVIAKSSNNISDYVDAFRQLESRYWDRRSISNVMINTNSWKIRAEEIINHISSVEDINLGGLNG